jgi:transcriptional regulator with GAF, ATPase, and Fis domain
MAQTNTEKTDPPENDPRTPPEAEAEAPRDRDPSARPTPEQSRTPASAGAATGRDDEAARLRARVVELQRERDHLVAIVDILQEISSSLHFVDILQSIARKLGDAFGLDRCAIFLSGEQNEVRLVASYEDPAIRNLVVDLNRYPELKRAFDSRETVFIPDAATDPAYRGIKNTLETRNVRSIIVVPIQWQDTVIGALFLRTDRDAEPFSDADVRFCQVVASLTAKALRNAHRFEELMRDQNDAAHGQRRSDLQRVALVAFIRRLLDRYGKSDDHVWAETLLPKASDEELERLVTVAMQVIDEEAKG